MTDPDIEESIRAFAHPGRRAMLELVWDAERPSSDLADHAGLSKSATSQHLKLLRDAGLVTVRVDGTAIGRLAARLLVERIEGREAAPRVVDVGFSVVQRGTS